MVKIKTKDFTLRPLKLADLKGYWEVCQDPEAQRNWTTYPKTIDEAKEDIKRMLKEVKEKDSTIFTIIVNKKYAGNVILQYQNFDKKGNEGRVHLWIHPKFRGRGLATAALEKLIEYGFDKKKMKRIFAQCKSINKGVMRINEKLGFKIVKRYVNDEGVEKVLWVKES